MPATSKTPDLALKVPALRVTGLSMAYGPNEAQVLQSVDLALEQGDILCLLGPSGCGKSSTLRAIAGLEPVSSGEVRAFGRLLSSATSHTAPEKRGFGMMFQDFALFPHLTVAQNVAFGLQGLKRAAVGARVKEMLERVGLADFAERYPQTLSGGQQQRIALARALAPDPKLLLLDEPFSDLDQSLRSQLRDDFLHLIKESGTAAVIVTHDPAEAMFMADEIAVMHNGRIEQCGAPDQLYYDPQSAFVARFFGDSNCLPGRVQNGRVICALGDLKETALPEDTALEVYIRPDGLLLCPVNDLFQAMPKAEIEAARIIGNQSIVHMELLENLDHLEDRDENAAQSPHSRVDSTNDRPHLHAQVQGGFLPKPGDVYGVGVNAELTYAFAC